MIGADGCSSGLAAGNDFFYASSVGGEEILAYYRDVLTQRVAESRGGLEGPFDEPDEIYVRAPPGGCSFHISVTLLGDQSPEHSDTWVTFDRAPDTTILYFRISSSGSCL
jgi:hypothetical protein